MEKMLALGVVLSASDMFSPVFGKAQKGLTELEKKTKALGAGLTKLGTASLALGAAITTPIGAALNSYQDLARAQGEIASLGIGDKGIGTITKAAREFSNEFAGATAADIVRASYDIKSGISSLSDEGVASFTKLAALTATATKATTADMTKLFALGHGIFKNGDETDMQFGERMSAQIALAVKEFRTEGADLIGGISNIGAGAKAMGVTLAEELAIIGTAKGAFNSASEAATGYRAFLAGVGKAQEKLGLQFTDSQGKMLPMIDVLQNIKDKYGDTIGTVAAQDELAGAFGSSEAVKIITGLINKTDSLTASTNRLKNANMQNVEEMAKSINKGREFELLGQQMNNLSSLIGQTFAPTALKVSEILGGVINKVSVWMSENEELAGTIGTVVAILGGALTVFGSVAIGVGAVTMALPHLITAFGVMKIATLGLGNAFLFMGKAMLFTPIGRFATIIAIAAFTIYKFWEPIKGFFAGLWDGIKTIFSAGWEFFKTIISWSPLGLVIRGWGAMFDWLSSKFAWFGKAVEKIKGIGSAIAGFFGFGGDGSTATNGQKKHIVNGKELSEEEYKQSHIYKRREAQKKLNSNINYAQMPKLNTPSGKGVNQNNNIQVTVNNPTSNVDVQNAVINAMANNRGLSDENF